MKILASDFDNTIYFLDDEEKNIRNSEAIRKFISQGNIFCIITGRNYSDLKILLNNSSNDRFSLFESSIKSLFV